MSKLSISRRDDFKGDGVLLVAVDIAGLDHLQNALRRAVTAGVGGRELLQAETVLEVSVVDAGHTVQLHANRTVWRMSSEKLDEIADKLMSLRESPRGGHHYVVIDGPVQTLFLSVNEYA